MEGGLYHEKAFFAKQEGGVVMAKEIGGVVVQPKLGLVGATMNAMALIAPGAFLWITYQLQAAATAPERGLGGERHLDGDRPRPDRLPFSRPCHTRSSRRSIRKRVLPVAPISRRRRGSTPRGEEERPQVGSPAYPSSPPAGPPISSTGPIRASWPP